ncbi:interferon alpha-inducible protein 27-like protein 2 [Nannospalax galili]|uniref:interferon alpha-inducible protein 27-like protein 2 n=1 Tax=Nannospalax galili TaxID=1026970 RepID=UPI00111C43A1|nr:interferon alpha-inducible protein 27-like protein 2 [Nannospalax galili]
MLILATCAVIGGVVTVAAVPTVLGAMGFTGAGIAASSLAANMMSASPVANGGGVAAGSLVATLQSAGSWTLYTIQHPSGLYWSRHWGLVREIKKYSGYPQLNSKLKRTIQETVHPQDEPQKVQLKSEEEKE